jgi:hypothetical protein
MIIGGRVAHFSQHNKHIGTQFVLSAILSSLETLSAEKWATRHAKIGLINLADKSQMRPQS